MAHTASTVQIRTHMTCNINHINVIQLPLQRASSAQRLTQRLPALLCSMQQVLRQLPAGQKARQNSQTGPRHVCSWTDRKLTKPATAA
jgi:hypothetical protein